MVFALALILPCRYQENDSEFFLPKCHMYVHNLRYRMINQWMGKVDSLATLKQLGLKRTTTQNGFFRCFSGKTRYSSRGDRSAAEVRSCSHSEKTASKMEPILFLNVSSISPHPVVIQRYFICNELRTGVI